MPPLGSEQGTSQVSLAHLEGPWVGPRCAGIEAEQCRLRSPKPKSSGKMLPIYLEKPTSKVNSLAGPMAAAAKGVLMPINMPFWVARDGSTARYISTSGVAEVSSFQKATSSKMQATFGIFLPYECSSNKGPQVPRTLRGRCSPCRRAFRRLSLRMTDQCCAPPPLKLRLMRHSRRGQTSPWIWIWTGLCSVAR